jgi:hypothetical protein
LIIDVGACVETRKSEWWATGSFFFVIIIINIIIIFLNIARFLIILLFMHAWLLSFELFVGMYRIPNMAGDQLWQVNTCGG